MQPPSNNDEQPCIVIESEQKPERAEIKISDQALNISKRCAIHLITQELPRMAAILEKAYAPYAETGIVISVYEASTKQAYAWNKNNNSPVACIETTFDDDGKLLIFRYIVPPRGISLEQFTPWIQTDDTCAAHYELIIDPLSFYTFSAQSQKFIIGHELAHAYLQHTSHKTINALNTILQQDLPIKVQLPIMQLLIRAYALSREHELEADAVSALLLKNITGIFTFFKECSQQRGSEHNNDSIETICDFLHQRLFKSHPPLHERYRYIIDLLQSKLSVIHAQTCIALQSVRPAWTALVKYCQSDATKD